jgi:hypothetical protein
MSGRACTIQSTALATLVAVIVPMATLAQSDASSQSTRPDQSYADLAELPDFSGLWEIARGGAFLPDTPKLMPEYAARAADYEARQSRGDIEDTPAANCVPPGLPVIMWEPYPFEFLFTPGKITIMLEAYSQWRQIFTDGRGHPEAPAPTFHGHSIGHWDGDTLVVETVSISTETPLGRNYGARHSDRMRIVERMRLAETDLLEIQTTIHDPVALAEPWETTRVYARHRDWTMTEYICQQNNRNFTTDDGKAGINLEHEVDE